jgi:hypothetical protein
LKNKLFVLLLVAALLVAMAAGVAAYRSAAALDASRAAVVKGLLEPAVALIEQNQGLLQALQAAQPAGQAAGVLEAYLAQVRRDGVPAHAASRQRLEQIAQNNVAITTLLTAYGPHARTPALLRDVERFREHAAAWQSRWGSVMEVFMAGGTYASADVPYPAQLPDRLRDELAAAR